MLEMGAREPCLLHTRRWPGEGHSFIIAYAQPTTENGAKGREKGIRARAWGGGCCIFETTNRIRRDERLGGAFNGKEETECETHWWHSQTNLAYLNDGFRYKEPMTECSSSRMSSPWAVAAVATLS
jgi:hypothetical protein